MKSKYILSAGTIGIVLMMLGQLSFAINDTLVKDIVVDSKNNMSVINIIFLTTYYTISKNIVKLSIIDVAKIQHLLKIYKKSLLEA